MGKIKIGDRVKAIQDSTEGIVQSINEQGIASIETSDGFLIPYLLKDLAVVAATEKAVKLEKIEETLTKKGLYFAVTTTIQGYATLYLINFAKEEQFVVLSNRNTDQWLNYYSVKLAPQSISKIPGAFSTSNWDSWNKWFFQILNFKTGNTLVNAQEVSLKLKQKSVAAGQELIPYTNEKGYLKRVDITAKTKNDENQIQLKVENSFKQDPQLDQIDLHADKLGLPADTLDLLNEQFRIFESHFDRCIAAGSRETTVIHGVGKGILKNSIHKYLSKNELVDSFKEAHKSKFGFGATIIYFK